MLKLTQLFLSITFFGIVYISALPSLLFAAEEIVIQDIDGNVRAQGELTPNGDGTVTMQVTDANGVPVLDGEVVTLTPVAGGAALTGTVIGGEVVFAGLSAGTYTVASSSVLVFSSVTVGAAVTGVAATGGALVGGTTIAAVAGVGAVGAGAAVAIENNSGGTDKPPISPFR